MRKFCRDSRTSGKPPCPVCSWCRRGYVGSTLCGALPRRFGSQLLRRYCGGFALRGWSHPRRLMTSCFGRRPAPVSLGFFRAGEITVPSAAAFDAVVHLAWGDVSTDSVTPPSKIRFRLKRSKTDQRRRKLAYRTPRYKLWADGPARPFSDTSGRLEGSLPPIRQSSLRPGQAGGHRASEEQ